MLLVVLVVPIAVSAQTNEITYQGKLVDNGLPANASYDFEFRLYDAASAGLLLDTRTRLTVVVSNGIFTVQLDFPTAMFSGANRYLEIFVRPAGSGGGYQQLLPRQALTSAPYSIRSLTATNADTATNATNAAQLGGMTASQYVLTTDPRMSDARNPLPNSVDYVQNRATPQVPSNFNISGNGTAGGTLAANIINSTTQYNLGGNRILSSPGLTNLFAGIQAGSANTTGSNNAFVGSGAGNANTTGSNNTFLGNGTGLVNMTGQENTFVGTFAGINNTTGNFNAFFGTNAGSLNNASDNAFFGRNAGSSSTTGCCNAFFGSSAGRANTTGRVNAFFGYLAGDKNTTGQGNSFFGSGAGNDNTIGEINSFFGNSAGSSNTTGIGNSFFGAGSGDVNTTGGSNSFFGVDSGRNNTTGNSNTFLGVSTGTFNTTGSNNTAIGAGADVGSNFSHATAIGADATVFNSNQIVLGRSAGGDSVVVPGTFYVNPEGGGIFNLCYGFSLGSTVPVAGCSSSLRYKTDVQPFASGLYLVRQLRPIRFTWKNGGPRDLGLGAEDVEKVEPLLVTYNDKGQVEGVKYDRVAVVLINAVNEQQTQIRERERQDASQQKEIESYRKLLTSQQAQLTAQQQEIAELKQQLCRLHPKAGVCKAARRIR
jgi:hypothetical protein